MPAHLRALPLCAKCGRPATQQLFTTHNSPVGYFCHSHAQAALREFVQAETSPVTTTATPPRWAPPGRTP